MRLFGGTDIDGNFSIRSVQLRPYRLPVKSTAAAMKKLSTTDITITTQYDPLLGWSPRPESRFMYGFYAYDAQGIRTKTPLSPPRISTSGITVAVFGDSYVHGDDVQYDDTFSAILERSRSGIRVLNLGYSGYGIDQAYLRWRSIKNQISPKVVVLGFQAENIKRCQNMFRRFYYYRSSIHLSKPRFILKDGALELVNSPTPSPHELAAVIATLPHSPLAAHEAFYDPADYADSFWLKSRLTAFFLTALARETRTPRKAGRNFYPPDTEPARLALRIIDSFRREAEEAGARFWILHIPRRDQLAAARRGKPLDYAALLKKLKKDFHVIDPTEKLLRRSESTSLDSLFTPQKHYSAAGNRVIAEVLAESL